MSEVLAGSASSEPADDRATETPVMSARGIVVRYGGVTAVDHVSLDLHAGEVTGLIGPNGAGKTTLLEVLCGFIRPRSGAVTLAGQGVNRLRPHQRARRGVARMFQHLELFSELTVRENLLVATHWLEQVGDVQIAKVSHALDLQPDLDRRVAELSQGRRKLVALGRAAVSEPRVILMDEPAAGLGPADSAAVATYIRDLASDGTAILLVDHDMEFVLPSCDRIVVLNFGSVIADGTPDEIRGSSIVQSAYLGESS